MVIPGSHMHQHFPSDAYVTKHQKSLFAIEVRKIIKDLKIADKPQTPDIFSHIAKYFDNKYNFSVVS